MSTLVPITPQKPRLSTKLRNAIDLHVRGGKTIKDACATAGMSTAGYHKAMKRPAVTDYLEEVQQRFVTEVESSKAVYKARALEVALDLMLNAKSETIKARMVEFLAGDGKGPQVAVHVDARRQEPKGYQFLRPGQQVVEIVEEKVAFET